MIEADELWSFVGNKRSVWRVWAALDAGTRQVVGLVIGDRFEFTGRCLWESLPDEHRTGANVYTDLLAQYRAVIPPGQHRPVGKGTGRTAHVERFWLTFRQRSARFVRRTLSCSKCPRNHPGAVWHFVRLYNAARMYEPGP